MYNDKTTKRQRLNRNEDMSFGKAVTILAICMAIMTLAIIYAPTYEKPISKEEQEFCRRLDIARDENPTGFYYEEWEWRVCNK